MSFAPLFALGLNQKSVNWLTPLWLVGVGVLVGLILVLLVWLLSWLAAKSLGIRWLKRLGTEFFDAINEGVLYYVSIVCLVLAVWGIAGTFLLRPPQDSLTLLSAALRVPFMDSYTQTVEVEAGPAPKNQFDVVLPPETEVALSFRGNELKEFTVNSTENISIAKSPGVDIDVEDSVLRVQAGREYKWERRDLIINPFADANPFADEAIETLYVRNLGRTLADVEFGVTTEVVYPQVMTALYTAFAVLGIYLTYLLQHAFFPRLSAIALATFKSEIAQPMFLILLILGIVMLFAFIYVPYNTFGEDIKMLKETSLTVIRVMCILLAVWGASTTIADEIEGRTALTVLSKPIGRRSFVLGKFMGITWTSALLCVVLGTVLMAVVSYKTIYDARELSKEIPTWQLCHLEVVSTLPSLVLVFMEVVVLAALSVAISTRLPMLTNFVICFSVYVLGHLTPQITHVTGDMFEVVRFVGKLIATVIPNLELFDSSSAIAAGFAIPGEYLAVAGLYCLVFTGICMFLALLMFEDRDVA